MFTSNLLLLANPAPANGHAWVTRKQSIYTRQSIACRHWSHLLIHARLFDSFSACSPTAIGFCLAGWHAVEQLRISSEVLWNVPIEGHCSPAFPHVDQLPQLFADICGYRRSIVG